MTASSFVTFNNDVTICFDDSTGGSRTLVPDAWQRAVFDTVNGLSHASIRTTKNIVADNIAWPGLRKQICIWAKTCVRCRTASASTYHCPIGQFTASSHRFDHFTWIPCRSHRITPTYNSRHIHQVAETIPLAGAQTTTCAKALALHWIARFGVPTQLTPDRESQFNSEFWSVICLNYTVLVFIGQQRGAILSRMDP